MNYKTAKQLPVHLPRVPATLKVSSAQDEFWKQKGTSGAFNACRQLNSTLRKGGRKKGHSLPGGKLQPLFKNDAKSDCLALGQRNVLPNIPGVDSTFSPRSYMKGNLDELPAPSPTTVRVYLSSNYQDMKLERVHLLQTAVPELQLHCSQLGLQFQLVDLHWGVGAEEYSWPTAGVHRQLHKLEIDECQRKSIGPNFVCLLGEKYDSRQLPPTLTEMEFELLNTLLLENTVENSELLAKYYLKDENAIPPVYAFQKPSEIDEMHHLEKTVYKALELAVLNEKLTLDRTREMTMSAVEEDIRQGILNTKDPRSHCLCYHREFREIDSNLTVEASPYIDTTTDEHGVISVDTDLRKRAATLSETLSEHLGVGNMQNFYLNWTTQQLEENSEFLAYLEKLSEEFLKDMKELIDIGYRSVVKEIGVKRNESAKVEQESLFHMQMCTRFIEDYTRSTDSKLFNYLHSFLTDHQQNKKPFVVYGESGTGKTTTLAVLVRELKTWFSDDCVVVARFLGSTWQSANIHRTVVSVTQQICLGYNIPLPAVSESFNTLHETLVTFRATLEKVSKESASTHPLFIVLDGINQLHPFQDSLKALWAMKDFPPNVHMIVSTISRLGPLDLLYALTNTITSADASMEVPPLDADEIRSFTEGFMEKTQRKLSENQKEVFSQAIQNNPQPLYIRELMQKALRFQSSHDVGPAVPKDVEGLFGLAIELLELEIGGAILQHFVAFITASPVGILERDLIDLLTNNKEVMEEVHIHHHKPGEKIFMFPQRLLSRMKLSLRDFLCERLVLGKVALAWSHNQVYQAAHKCYDVIYPGIIEADITEEATNFSLSLHEQFVNVLLPDRRSELLCELPEPLSDVTSDMLLHHPQAVCIENLHKLHYLLTHLLIMVPLEGLSRVTETVLFNFQWLYTKLQTSSLSGVIHDIIQVLLLVKGLEKEEFVFEEEDEVSQQIDLLLHFFQMASPALSLDAENLAVEIIARMSQLQELSPHFRTLVEGAQEHLASSKSPCVTPLYGCLPSPGGEVRFSFPGATHVIGSTSGARCAVMFSQKEGIGIWRLEAPELLQHFNVNKEQSVDGVLPAHQAPYVIIGHYSHLNHVMEMVVADVDTGVDIINTTLPQKFEALALSLDDQVLYMATTVGTSQQRCIVGLNAKTKEAVCTMLCGTAHSDCIRKMLPVEGVRGNMNALITLGGRKSKDLVYWDVDKSTMEYSIQMEDYVDLFEVNPERSYGIGCSRDDGVLLVVDLKTGTVKQTMKKAEYKDAQDMYVSESGDFVILATYQDGIAVHSIPKEAQVKMLAKRKTEDGSRVVRASKITMDESEHLLFVGYQTGLIDIYSIITGQVISTLSAHTRTVNTLHVRENDSLLSAADDGQAIMWSYGPAVWDHMSTHVMSGDEQFECTLPADQDQGQGDGDGTQITTGNTTGPGSDGKPEGTERISCILLAQNDKVIITGSYDGSIKMWNADSPDQPLREITEGCEHGVTDLYLAYRHKLLIGHVENPAFPTTRILQVWRMEGDLVAFEQDAMVCVYTSCVMLSDDGILTLSPCPDDTDKGMIVAMFDLFEMRCVASLHCNIYGNMDCTNLRLLGFTTAPQSDAMEVESIQDSENTTPELTLSGGERQYAVLDYYPAPGMSFFFTFVIHGRDFTDISMDHHEPIHIDSMSPKCTLILPKSICVTGTKTGSLALWNAATQTVISDFCHTPVGYSKRRRKEAMVQTHDGAVTCLAGAPDGVHVVSGGIDGKLKLWNIARKTLVHTFSKHTDQILDLSISASNLLVSSSKDNTVSIWDLSRRQLLTSFYAHHHVVDVILSGDQSRLIGRILTHNPTLLTLKTTNL